VKAKEARKAIADAKKAVERNEVARREIFRKALMALFNEHRLYLIADGDQSAHLRIEELRDGQDYPAAELPK
jgi:formate dehydrogenase maturation protein FdhE